MRGRPPAAAKPGSAGRGLAVEGRLALAALRGSGPPVPLDTARGKEVLVRAGRLSGGGRPVVIAQVQHSERGPRTERGRCRGPRCRGRPRPGAAVAIGHRALFVRPRPCRGSCRPGRLGEGCKGLRSMFRGRARCGDRRRSAVMGPGPLTWAGRCRRHDAAGACVHLAARQRLPRSRASRSDLRARGGIGALDPLWPRHDGRGRRSGCFRGGRATARVPSGALRRAASCELASPDPASRATPELADVVPAMATGSYDVRRVIAAIADDGEHRRTESGVAPSS